jgi:hypothetical protein
MGPGGLREGTAGEARPVRASTYFAANFKLSTASISRRLRAMIQRLLPMCSSVSITARC